MRWLLLAPMLPWTSHADALHCYTCYRSAICCCLLLDHHQAALLASARLVLLALTAALAWYSCRAGWDFWRCQQARRGIPATGLMGGDGLSCGKVHAALCQCTSPSFLCKAPPCVLCCVLTTLCLQRLLFSRGRHPLELGDQTLIDTLHAGRSRRTPLLSSSSC